jgi:hypothetical protein
VIPPKAVAPTSGTEDKMIAVANAHHFPQTMEPSGMPALQHHSTQANDLVSKEDIEADAFDGGDASTVTGTFRTALGTFSTIRQSKPLSKTIDEFGEKKAEGKTHPNPPVSPARVNYGTAKNGVVVKGWGEITPQQPKVSYSPMPSRRKSALAGLGPRPHGHARPPPVAKPEPEVDLSIPEAPKVYPLLSHFATLPLLTALLPYLSFADFLAISSLNHESRNRLDEGDFREEILERYLSGVGYWRWRKIFGGAQEEVEEPLSLDIKVVTNLLF